MCAMSWNSEVLQENMNSLHADAGVPWQSELESVLLAVKIGTSAVQRGYSPCK